MVWVKNRLFQNVKHMLQRSFWKKTFKANICHVCWFPSSPTKWWQLSCITSFVFLCPSAQPAAPASTSQVHQWVRWADSGGWASKNQTGGQHWQRQVCHRSGFILEVKTLWRRSTVLYHSNTAVIMSCTSWHLFSFRECYCNIWSREEWWEVHSWGLLHGWSSSADPKTRTQLW